MFGSRGPLLDEHDKPGGGAQPAPPSPPTQQPATPPAGEQSKLFSQDEVNRLVGDARREGRDAASRQRIAPVPASDATADEKLTLKALQAKYDDLELRSRFDKRATRLGIDDDASDDLFELFRAQRPTDENEWFTKKVKTFNLKQPAQNAVTAPAVLAGPQQPPISDKGSPAPGNALDWEREFAENPVGMSAAAFQRMVAKHGEEAAWRMRVAAASGQAGRIKVSKPQDS